MFVWSSLHVFAVVTYLFLAFYVLIINPRERLNHACAATILCMAIWSLELAFNRHPDISYETARLWVNIGSVGWIGLGPSLLVFTHIFTGNDDKLKKWWYHLLTTVPTIIFFIAQLKWVIVGDLIRRPYGWTHTWAPTFWFPVFCTFYVAMYTWSLFLLARFQRRTERLKLKSLSRMLFGTVLVCLVVASTTDTLLPMLNLRRVPSMGPLVTLIWAAGLTYALVKFKFLTISPATAAQNILATMSDLVVLCDPQGKIVTANRATTELLGYSQQTLKGNLFHNYIQVSNDQSPQFLRQGFGFDPVHNARVNLKTRNSDGLPVMLSNSLLTDDQGELVGTVTVAKDISALEKAEQSLRESEKRHRELVENINDVIFTIDPKGTLTYVSPRIKDLAGYAPMELVGRHVMSVVPEEEHPKLMERMAMALKGETGPTNYRMIKKDGTHTWVRVSGRPIYKKHRSVGMLGVLSDISRLMQAMDEKLELEAKLNRAQKMEAIGTLAGGVAHDLNNILSGITSYPDYLLMRLSKESDLRKPLELIRSSGVKAATIVQDLLTLARRGVANFEVLNFNRVLEVFFESPEYKKQRSFFPMALVEVNLASDLHNIEGSEVHLTKSIMNLLSNAFEALGENGRIVISTTNHMVDQDTAEAFDVSAGEYVKVMVQDNGMGILSQDLHRIFEPFYTKKVMGHSGTGLGMAVVWGTVHDHKGFIDAHSEPGKGARFDLYFPVSHSEIADKEGPVPRALYQGSGESILVVDDVEEQRRIAKDLLSELGYCVETACCGEDALSMAQNEPADLLLLDMIMDPGMDGLETFEKILEINPNQKAILVSGYSETDRAKRAMELGALSYIKKPYTMETIGMAIRRALDA